MPVERGGASLDIELHCNFSMQVYKLRGKDGLVLIGPSKAERGTVSRGHSQGRDEEKII